MSERRFTPLSTVVDDPLCWLWQDRIPLGAITLIDGDPGTGKSTLTYDLIARLTSGRPMPECKTALPASGAILLQAEDDAGGTIKPNLLAAGADVSRILVMTNEGFAGNPFSLPSDVALLETEVANIRARLIVLDPLSRFVPGGNLGVANAAKALAPLAAFAARCKVAVVLVRHLVKTQGANALTRGAGSMGIIGLARSALLVGRDPSTDESHRSIVALAKSNLSEAPALAYRTIKHATGATTIEWLGTTTNTADDIAMRDLERRKGSELDYAMHVLYAILSEGPLPANQVAEGARDAQVSNRTLTRAKTAMGVRSYRDGRGLNICWKWTLPEDPTLYQRYFDRELDELVRKLIHPDPPLTNEDPPLPGDEWKEGLEPGTYKDPDDDDDGNGVPS